MTTNSNNIKTYLKYILRNGTSIFLVSILLYYFSYEIGSSYWSGFLKNNIIIILITLLAINIATTGILLTRLSEIKYRYPDFDYSKILRALKITIVEQLILIGIATIVILLLDSSFYRSCTNLFHHAIPIILIAIYIYALYLLYVTGNAIFSLFKNDVDNPDKEKGNPNTNSETTQ